MRLAIPGVLPIEVWDLPAGGRLLQAWRADPAFARHLADVVVALRRDPPAAFSSDARAAASRIAHVHLLGGGVDLVATASAIGARVPCTFTADPFAAARAGAALVAGAGCVDVGQSTIKIVDGDRTRRIERDLAVAPLRDEVAPGSRRLVRDATVRWLASILASVDAPRLVVALPCEIADGVPRSCTYCWPDPDPELVPELARRSGKPLAFLNDAELAAAAAVPRDGVTLVLTLGFGVGGALVVR